MEQLINRILDILLTLPVILIALSVHEMMHGYAAYRLGDPTAKYMGRLSMNPLRHIDPIGFISLLVFRIGWAKPVSVDPRYFKKPKRDMALTALAGPLSNFALAFLSSFLYVFLYGLGIRHQLFGATPTPYYFLVTMAGYMVSINLGLGVFNLIPVPPLDGSKILYAFLPYQVLYKIAPYERYFQFVMILLLALGILSTPIHAVVSVIYRVFITIAQGVIL
ncbi:MAG: site-2 protease family protein [Clostridia bacterium]|nr:site-2 protease family protein [Clostridia bacterium]